MKTNNAKLECQTCPVLSKCFFSDLSSQEIDLLNVSKRTRVYEKGQIIYYQDDPAHSIFHLAEGKVKAVHTGKDGREKIIFLAKEGDVFGYHSVLDGKQYIASAVVMSKVKVCVVPKEIFLSFIENNNTVLRRILSLLCKDIRHADYEITDLANKSVRERIAIALILLKKTYGLEEDKATLNGVLSRQEIAELAGTSMETASRLISEFKTDKIIGLSGKKIRILDDALLRKTANI